MGKVNTSLSTGTLTLRNMLAFLYSVVSIIKYLEALCQAYSVPIGIVDGGK